ncbi:Zinc finger, C2H2-like domain-containing protein [Strongyloides ratti]|uniref:Zinc finger, C2H2-like domain-containing protein n=1 Tax=Strongyloides ratti TaxID=34506 RepID=A0A090LHR0_STRRB|nr:Zinc finger, C2H2-like domain-containing protein [Strongyloides ratti]CEF67055.1 Zinc finger, C2H2-like domain-containing protein [Strongyloides ratti]
MLQKMAYTPNRQYNGAYYKPYSSERQNSFFKRDSIICPICENSEKSYTHKEYELHCVTISHIIRSANLYGESQTFFCNICEFKCFSKDDMIDHVNTLSHDENVESYQKNTKYKNLNNVPAKKRKIVEGTDSGIVVPTKCHGYHGNGETMTNLSKASTDGGFHVTRSVRNEVINKNDDKCNQISAPRFTVLNSKNVPGIRENNFAQKKRDASSENFNISFPKQAVPIKKTTNDETVNRKCSKEEILLKDDIDKNFKFVEENQISDLETITLFSTIYSSPSNDFNNMKSVDCIISSNEKLNNNDNKCGDVNEILNKKYENVGFNDLMDSLRNSHEYISEKEKEAQTIKKEKEEKEKELQRIIKEIDNRCQNIDKEINEKRKEVHFILDKLREIV